MVEAPLSRMRVVVEGMMAKSGKLGAVRHLVSGATQSRLDGERG